MPTRNSWSSSSTSTCLPNLRHASPRRQSTQPAQPNRCSGDFRGGDVDSIQFFVRIGKVGLGPGVLAPTYGSLGTSVTTATEIVNARLGDNRGEHAAYLGPPNRVPSVRV